MSELVNPSMDNPVILEVDINAAEGLLKALQLGELERAAGGTPMAAVFEAQSPEGDANVPLFFKQREDGSLFFELVVV